MSTTKAVLGVFACLIAGAILLVTLRGSGAPDASAFESQFRAIEERLAGADHDAGAWEALRARTDAFKAWEREWYDAMQADAVDPRDPDITLALTQTGANNPIAQASDALATAYADSALHDDLEMILDAPGLRAASMMDQTEEAFGVIDDPITHGASMARYEAARMVIASRAGDHETAIRCASNIERLADLTLATPCMVALLVRQRATDALFVRTNQLIEENAMHPDLARTLLDTASRDHEADRERVALMLRADGISMQRMLTMLYNGADDTEDFDLDIPRRRWAQFDTSSRAIADWYEQGAWFVAEGPNAEDPPEFEWTDPYEHPEPVAYLLPAIANFGERVFEARALRAETILRLAIHIYTQHERTPPPSLDALVDASILASVPADPYAEDGAFVYTLDPDETLGYTLEGGAP